MSDAGNIAKVRQVPERLVHFLWSRILHYVDDARNLSAEIHQLNGQEISLVFGITPEANGFLQSDNGEQLDQKLEAQATETNGDKLISSTILVANLPPTADEEVLEFLFESKRKGGGPVKNVQINKQSRWAIVEFFEPDAVDIVMGKLPIVLMETELAIHRYSPSLQANEVIQSLKIHGLPKELTEEMMTREIEETIITGSDETASAEYKSAEDEMVQFGKTASLQTITHLDPIQLKMLTASTYVETISDQYPNVKVKIVPNRNEISFEGPSADVEPLKLNIYEKLTSFSIYILHNIDEERMKLYQSERVWDYIKQTLNKNNILGVWELRDEDLIICSLATDIAECSSIVCGSLKEAKFDVCKESAATFLSPLWKKKLNDLNKDHDILLKAVSNKDVTEVQVITTDGALNNAVSAIQTFLKDQLSITTERVYSEAELFPKSENLLNTDYFVGSLILKLIAKSLSPYYVSINAEYSPRIGRYTYTIIGTFEGREKAKARLRDFTWLQAV